MKQSSLGKPERIRIQVRLLIFSYGLLLPGLKWEQCILDEILNEAISLREALIKNTGLFGNFS